MAAKTKKTKAKTGKKTKAKISRLTEELLQTARDMQASGLMTRARS